MQLHYVVRKQVSRVDLHKDGATSIGIVLKDGVKNGSRPVIRAIKKGSVAYRSHCVSERDAIVSVCGQDARGMSRRDFKHLLREAESKIELELEYQIQEACLNRCGVYRMERIDVKLRKESETFGFVLRKHGFKHSASPGYPIISNLKEGGPADRDGRLKAGDRLLKIDELDLEVLSLSQVADILQAKREATFTIEYKIALIENSQIKLGERTSLEIDCPDADLGLVLCSAGSRMVIEEICKGSLADRCGAFRVGDDILSINDMDVVLLSTSKANSLLRSFRKEPGRLVLVANIERLVLPRPNSLLSRGKFKQFFNSTPPQLTPEWDQQVPSSILLLAPCNSPQSLFNGNFEENTCSSFDGEFYNFQIKIVAKLRELIDYIVAMEKNISSLVNNINESVEDLSEAEINNDVNRTFNFGSMSHLKVLHTQTKNLAYSMAIQVVKYSQTTSNRHFENGMDATERFKGHSRNSNQNVTNHELMDNLVEIYTKKLISKQNFEKLKFKINEISSNCKKCDEVRMLVALTIQKILLIASLDNKTEDICFLNKKLIEETLRVQLCENCRMDSVFQNGSEISRDNNQFNSLDCSRTKPSCSTSLVKDIDSLSVAASKPKTSKMSGESSLNSIHSKTSKLIFSSETRFQQPVSTVVASSTNGTISEASNNEDVLELDNKTNTSNVSHRSNHKKRCQSKLKAADSNVLACFASSSQHQSEEIMIHDCPSGFAMSNCCIGLQESDNKTKTSNVLHKNNYEKLCQNELKAADYNGSACFTTSSHNQSEEKMIDSSSRFAMSNCCIRLHDRESISGESTSQLSARTPKNTPRNSFSYETESLPCKDNLNFFHKNNGKNHKGNIHKKIFKEKGLPRAQRQNCKSAEVLADSDSESLKHSKARIYKHSSDPAFLSMGYQSQYENTPNGKEDNRHLYTNVETPKPKMAKDDTNRNWSPFHKSDHSDHPNLLDIPNWSAKSSHSLRRIGQVSNERTMQDAMDVTLRNEGKGYGIGIEFPDLPSDDLTQVPQITSVRSQGAAQKIGTLQRGDRVLTINGQNTKGMTIMEFENLKEEAFSADEVLLRVEFDVAVKDPQFGIFDVCVTKTSKTGLVYNDFKKGSPLVVKGIVKGSPAHRCGLLFPGDEVLYVNNVREEFYDVSKNDYEKLEYVTMRVRRQTFEEKFGDEMHLDEAEVSLFKSHDLNRTSIHSNHDSSEMLLEQELTLYRDPVSKDFGFLIGQDQISKNICITGVRPDGPADRSKAIRTSDIILQVNGVDMETNYDGPIASLFQPTGDRLELKTRRVLKYE